MEQRMNPRVCAPRRGLLSLALLCWVGVTGAAQGPPLNARQKECLQERARVLKDVAQFLRAGKHAEAVAACENQVRREREAFGESHEEVLSGLQVLAQLHELREDFSAARKVWQEVVAIRGRLQGQKHWRVAEVRVRLADVERLARMDRAQRGRVGQANRLNARALQLLRAERPREALPLAREALATRKELLGEAHPAHADSLNTLGYLHLKVGDYPRARELFERALQITKDAVGEDHPACATCLDYLAHLCLATGEYARARAPAERALHLRKRALGEGHAQYAEGLSTLAAVYRELGEYDRARQALEGAQILYQRLVGPAHPDSIANLHNLGSLYREMGEYARAREPLQRACELTKKVLGEGNPHYATSLASLADLHGNLGEYAQAHELLQKAYRLHRELLGEAHPLATLCLNNLGLLYKDMGEYAKARESLERARDLHKRSLGEGHPAYATGLHNLAGLYRVTGEYARARELGEQALALRKKHPGEGHPNYTASLHEAGMLSRDGGDYSRARELLEKVCQLHRQQRGDRHPAYAASLADLASLCRETGESDRALDLYGRARDLYQTALGARHPAYATTLNGLGLLYLERREYGKARELFEQARDVHKAVHGENHPSRAASLQNLALLHLVTGDYAAARTLSEQACDLIKRSLGERHRYYVNGLLTLAWIYHNLGHAADASRCIDQVTLLGQAGLGAAFTALSERERLNALLRQRVALDVALSCDLDGASRTGRLYRAVLAWKGALAARSAEESLARRQPGLQPLAEKLRTARASLARLSSLTPAGEQGQADWRQRFDRLEKEKEALEILLAQKSAAYLRWRQARQADPAQVAEALPAKAALVDFLQYIHWSRPRAKVGPLTPEPRLVAFVLVRGREPALVPLGPVEGLDRAIQSWRQAVKGLRPSGPAGAELARRLWEPLRKHLGGVQTVLIAPDGPVSAVPFAALPGGKPGTYLIEELAIGHVTSGPQLLEPPAGREADGAGGLLAVGGLRYGEPPAEGSTVGKAAYRYLPGTRVEVERIAGLYRRALPGCPAPRVLSGGAVDAASFKDQLEAAGGGRRPRYLHLATHGLFEAPSARVQALRWPRDEALPFELAREYRAYARNPLLLSGLVLAGANEAPARGILRAEEVADLDLRGCALAVLSACDTGLGKVAGGEGVLGLQRAFQEAGARAVVVSLWKVHDAATSVLMEEFYANLWQKKLTRLEALRQAQLTVLRDPARVQRRLKELRTELTRMGIRGPGEEARPLPPGGPRSHPALWAAFVLSGDFGPVPAP